MAFKQVFYALREVFPQIDLRILKAVASEYSSDVDAAVEFVISDVLPAVSEPTETHYTFQDIDYAQHDHTNLDEKAKSNSGRISFLDQRNTEDVNVLFSPSAGSSRTFGEYNPFPVHDGPLCSDNKMEECAQIEDKVVVNETRTGPTVLYSMLQDHYAQVGSSSTSAIEPHVIEYEQTASGAFFGHCSPKIDEVLPEAGNIGNYNPFDDNYKQLDSLASSESMLPLFIQSPSDCAVKCEGQMPLELSKDENMHDFSKSEDNCCLETLFVNCRSKEDGHTSKNLPNAPAVHALSKSEDDYDSQLLFEKELSVKVPEAESVHEFSKPEDNYSLETLFLNFCSTEDTSMKFPSAPIVEAHSKSEDNYDLQVLFENIDTAGKEWNFLITAEKPELYKSDNDGNFYNLFGEQCTGDSTAQLPFQFLGEDENEQSLYKFDNQQHLFNLFSSSKLTGNSLHIFDNEDQPSTDLKNPAAFTSACNLGDDYKLSELFSLSQNASLPDLDSKCEVRNETEKEIMCSNTVDRDFACPIVELGTSQPKGKNMVSGAFKCKEFREISIQSYHITEINKHISDFAKSKEALDSLYESTTMKMKEVALQEEKSRQAKQDAVKAHKDFLVMVEHFNQLIHDSKESNDKQAQVVCEEKSSLAALAQDLKSRLTKLSSQRDEALTTVQEIKFELDARLTTSMEEEAAAREQIIQQEKAAILARNEKEAITESTMEESRNLQKEAEENILLRGFLLDRGRIIDILQEEISSMHANVAALKERTSRGKLNSTLVTRICSATSSDMDDCKSASIDRGSYLGNDENMNVLPLEEIEGSNAHDHATFSDDEWEVVETTQA